MTGITVLNCKCQAVLVILFIVRETESLAVFWVKSAPWCCSTIQLVRSKLIGERFVLGDDVIHAFLMLPIVLYFSLSQLFQSLSNCSEYKSGIASFLSPNTEPLSLLSCQDLIIEFSLVISTNAIAGSSQ